MKTIYVCDICGRRSSDRNVIAECEEQPITKFETVKVGDIVYRLGNGYGWWGYDTSWFREDAGDPASENHHERARRGYPLFAVMEIGTPVYAQRPGVHHEVAVLLSPAHASFTDGIALCWCPSTDHKTLVKHRETSAEEFEELKLLYEQIRSKKGLTLL